MYRAFLTFLESLFWAVKFFSPRRHWLRTGFRRNFVQRAIDRLSKMFYNKIVSQNTIIKSLWEGREERYIFMTGRDREYKITGDPKDPKIIKLVHPGNRIFRRVRITNTRMGDKKPLAAELVLDQKSHGLLFTRKANNRTEVCGFVDERTGMFVMDMDGDLGDTAHIKFLKMAADRANDALLNELNRQRAEDKDARDAQGYYPEAQAVDMLEDYLYNPAKFNADMGKQLSNYASRPMPNVNEYMVFSDDAAWNQDIYVTRRAPYANPVNRVLSASERAKVDGFLDVFFDGYNKKAFSWYMGACLLNVPVYDERVSRMAVMTSSHGGSGKSSLMSAIVNGVLTPDYCSIKDDFDRFFLKANRFGTDSLDVRRLTVYSEATWGVAKDGECSHDFEGLNVSAIKSMITDGFITKEPKFGDPVTVRSSGLHMVLTNYLPCITDEDVAMKRRILPILMRPTSMVDKAEALGLMGRDTLEAFVRDNAELFAAYFADAFRSDEYMFIREEYSFTEEREAVNDSQSELEEGEREEREELTAVKGQGFVEFMRKAKERTGVDTDRLVDDVVHVIGGNVPEGVEGHMKAEGQNLYVDGSKSFLMRYGRHSTAIRKLLQEYYGPSVRKFHKRMFQVPLSSVKAAEA